MKIFYTVCLIILLNILFLSCKSQKEIRVLHSFDGKDGASPIGTLTIDKNTLYGKTSSGGKNGKGVLFKVNTDNSGYKVLYDFTSGAGNGMGKEPHHDAMTLSGQTLFGCALNGGINDNGVIFRINVDGSGYDTLHVFKGGSGDGAQPHSDVRIFNNTIYGLTAAGGANNKGTIYKINTDGSGLSVLYSFEKPTGDEPHGSVILSNDGNKLLGMTRNGGKSDFGVVFSFDLSNSQYNVLHNFEGGKNDGKTTEHGFLTKNKNKIFGLTQFGGESGQGTVFSMNEDGKDFKIEHSFGSEKDDGQHPFGSLALSGDYLYGTTRRGGENDRGTVFRIKTDGKDYESLYSLDTKTSGEYPIDNVVFNAEGTELYCFAQQGGVNDDTGKNQYGTVFKIIIQDSKK